MKVSLCSVGTEIVAGDQVDTNAAWLSQRLREVGIDVRYHLAVPDDLAAAVDGLRWLMARSDVVLVGGGLGPTPDDLTREAVAEAADTRLRHDDDLEEAVRARFSDRGLRMPAANLRQARLPEGAVSLAPLGTAPGFRMELPRSGAGGPCLVVALPGVPWELRGMVERDVLPDLQQRAGSSATVTRVVHVTGRGESAVAETLGPLLHRAERDDIEVSFLATGSEVQVRVTARGSDPAAARARTEPVVAEVRQLLGRVVAGVDEASLEEAVRELLADAGQRVAFAESATAGAVAARVASVPGASAVLAGGVVVYATAAKTDVLGVPEDMIAEHTPVSEEVTRELAVRVRDLFGADWGVGVTGVAGPDPQAGRDVGAVVWAVCGPDGHVTARGADFPGDREAIRRRLATAALDGLRQRLLDAADGA